MNDLKIKLKRSYFEDITYLQIILLAVFSFLFPLYICDTNRHNLLFTAAEIPLLIYLFANIGKKQKYRKRLFLFLLAVYFLTFLYYDILYLQCYWALFYKTFSFLMLYDFASKERDTRKKQTYSYAEITDIILYIFSFAVLLSIVANVIGVDAIYLDFNEFHIRSTKSGVFLDERLTWVFMHKSTYGLLLILALALLIKRKTFPYRKIWICIYFIAAIRINSMVSLTCMCVVPFAYYIETKTFNRKTLIKMVLAFFIGIFTAGIIYYVVASERNMSSLGDRVYIWRIYADSLSKYPHGMGKTFFTESFWLAAGGRNINNFHNVYLNELLHYSIPVGTLFTLLIYYYPINFIKSNPSKAKNIILLFAISMPMIFDQALNDLIFPIFLIMLKLCFANTNESERISQ